MRLKEALIGVGISVMVFLIVIGYDITPLILLLGTGLFVMFFLEHRGMISSTLGSIFSPTQMLTFNDIGGQETAKQELREALDFLLKMDETSRLGIRPLKGILLTGPPGTGKTLLARAAASYTDAVFLACSGSEFIEMYAGVGAQRVRGLFKRAREMALKAQKNRSVIFMDEIDVLGSKRGSHSGHLEYDQTINQLLVEMDGLSNERKVEVLVIAATNRADLLDPALLRPGRFDRQVNVDLPDKKGRRHILELHTRNKPLAGDVNLEAIAAETFGFSGAHLESVANEAAILTMRNNGDKIYQRHFKEAVDKVMLGEKLERVPAHEEMFRVAVHEVGHAIISENVRQGSVSHLTISPRGNALGYMRQIPADDHYLYTKEQLEQQIRICLAGALAEELVLGDKSTGSTNDFNEAIKLAKRIVFTGLSEVGIVAEEDFSKEKLQEAVSKIIAGQQEITNKTLVRYKNLVNELAAKLVNDESLPGEALREVLQQMQECA